MTSHWPQPMQLASQRPAALNGDDAGRFEVELLRHGPRTRIGRQFVSYPFHLTRPFALDAALPSLLTIYQQSSSGGLYRADRLSCGYDVGAVAAAHITTQAATVVHDCYGQPVKHATKITVGDGGFLALTPDPLVLFPGAACMTTIEASIAPGSVLLLGDAFCCHDPQARSRPFDQLSSDVSLREEGGRLLVRDSFHVSGSALIGKASPTGDWRVVSNYMLVGEEARLPDRAALAVLANDDRIAIGITELANNAGWGVRCLATDAVAAGVFSERLFALAVHEALGQSPVPRRK